MSNQEKAQIKPEKEKKLRVTFNVWRCFGIIFLGLALLVLFITAGMLAYGSSYALSHYTNEVIRENGPIIVTYVLLLIGSAVCLSVAENRKID